MDILDQAKAYSQIRERYVYSSMRSRLTIEQFQEVYRSKAVQKASLNHALEPTPENREKLLIELEQSIILVGLGWRFV